MNLLHKKFLFATISIICVTVATVLRGYDGEIYWKLVGTVVGIFLTAQAITDTKNGGKS